MQFVKCLDLSLFKGTIIEPDVIDKTIEFVLHISWDRAVLFAPDSDGVIIYADPAGDRPGADFSSHQHKVA